jgi:L-ribulose-5-phosphate 4-epimerase
MLLEQLREIVWKCNLDLPKNNLVAMTSGNVSGRDRETGLVVIKPSGYSYEEMTAAHMVVVDLDGRVVEGDLKPSTDTDAHLYVYRHRSDVFGMVHTHSPYATSFAVLGQPIPACLTASAMLGGKSRWVDMPRLVGMKLDRRSSAKSVGPWLSSCKITAFLRSARRRSMQPR